VLFINGFLITYQGVGLKNLFLVSLILLLTACASTTPQPTNKAPTTKTNTAHDKEPTFQQKVYYFQHRMLPEWVHKSNGNFYLDMMNGDIHQLRRAAAEVISVEYAEAIQIIPYEKSSAVLFVFPEPKAPANCFFAFVKKEGDSYTYTTYENTLKLGLPDDDKVVGVVGSWDKEGNHNNYGARGYSDVESFVKEVLHVK